MLLSVKEIGGVLFGYGRRDERGMNGVQLQGKSFPGKGRGGFGVVVVEAVHISLFNDMEAQAGLISFTD